MNYSLHESKFGLPLVSVIITNYNYAAFLAEAFGSVEAQTYPHVECIIVDDASTDESSLVLDEIDACSPDIIIIRKLVNEGQTAAFLTGFTASSGDYVVFLDADDVLLPPFVEMHIFAHLSLRIPVGFTSSDMLQTSGPRIVRASMTCFSNYVASGKGTRKGLVRRIDECAPFVWTIDPKYRDDFPNRIHFVDPSFGREWVYAPTSGNCFRRDALDMFLRKGNFMKLKHNADTYLNKAVSLLSGAALIDIPLGVYRMHGENGFARHPELYGVEAVEPEKARDAEYWAWRALLDRLVDDATLFIHKLGFDRYRNIIVMMQRTCPFDSSVSECESLSGYVETKLRSKSALLTALVGEKKFLSLLNGVDRVRIAPRPWSRPFAELFLSLGRVLGVRKLSTVGEWLWHL